MQRGRGASVRWDETGYYQGVHVYERLYMLLALILLLLVLAVVGGIALNPLLFLIVLLALVVFMTGRGRSHGAVR